jgi:hypothetical protein
MGCTATFAPHALYLAHLGEVKAVQDGDDRQRDEDAGAPVPDRRPVAGRSAVPDGPDTEGDQRADGDAEQ